MGAQHFFVLVCCILAVLLSKIYLHQMFYVTFVMILSLAPSTVCLPLILNVPFR